MQRLIKLLFLLSILISSAFTSTTKFTSLSKIRGVNLGGWLVLEPWIRPSLFKQFEETPRNQTAVDETTFNKVLGLVESKKQLEEHWSSWVTEDDFQKLSKMGINFVRIPFGYWILGDYPEQFATGDLQHLDRGIQLAQKYNISVLLDLHAVPGSQNGFDNSGLQCASKTYLQKCATDCPWDLSWGLNDASFKQTISVLKRIADRYKGYDNIYGIQFVNEPNIPDFRGLQSFYGEAYVTLANIAPSWNMIMHDAFKWNQWEGFMSNKQEFPKAIMDTHIYLAFSEEIMKAKEEYRLNAACDLASQINFMNQKQLPTFVGEWSLATNDCAQWLTGFKQPVKFSQLGLDCVKDVHSDSFYTELARNFLWAFEQGQGWVMWNFKTESADEWSYMKAVEKGWIPKNTNEIPAFISSAKCALTNHLDKTTQSFLQQQ